MMVDSRAQKIDDQVGKWSGRLGLIIVGWLACGTYYGTWHLKHVETVELPKALDSAGCQTARARTAEQKLAASEAGKDVDDKTLHCPLPPKVAPSSPTK